MLHRKSEDDSPTVPYLDGPIEVLPGIWLGSEDNARDWKGLVERGITSVLNVAQEVNSPFETAAFPALRSFSSSPDLNRPNISSPVQTIYYPGTSDKGRPRMHYKKFDWSHGETDLVRVGFPQAMEFVDAALSRQEGVLVQ